MIKEEIILIGGGGHCKSCIDVIEAEGKYTIAGIPDMAGKKYMKPLDKSLNLPPLFPQPDQPLYQRCDVTEGAKLCQNRRG